jgi:uncharacterized RDD family membrane protein YckC
MVDGTRSALIVASDAYTDPGLRRLRAPASDAQALAGVLRDPQIGGFEVRTLLNEPAHEVNLAVEEFFADRRPDDLLLLHFSCHGVKDEGGELYFATANTKLRRLGATAVAAEFVNRRMSRSRSRRVVLLLDCCYAGAFERGMTARAGTGVAIEEQFGGRGRAVITASSAMEYAFEGDELADSRELAPSVFTSALVEGLETGEADRDQDGLVALDELYDYVYDKVQAATPNQTPGKWTFGVQGDLYIARRARPVTTPTPLPPELQQAIDHPLAAVRAGAVQELARLLESRHAGLALAGRLALERLTEDDSRAVSAAATAALGTQAQPAPPQPVPPQPVPPEPVPPEPVPPEPVLPEPVLPEPVLPEPVLPEPVLPEPVLSEPVLSELPSPPEPVPPRLKLSASVVDFGRLPPLHGKSPERRVWLGNAGGGTLNARAMTLATWLKLRQVGDELVVAVDTTTVGDHEGLVTVESDGGSATIRVTATVDPQPPTAAVGQPPTAEQTTTGQAVDPPPWPLPPPEHATRGRRRPRQDGSPGLGGDPYSYQRPDGKSYQSDELAIWRQRAVAGIIDLLPLLPGITLFVLGGYQDCYDSTCYNRFPSWFIWVGLAWITGIRIYNRWYLQGKTGQSWGKRATHLKLVRMADKQPIGAGAAFVRGLAHLLDILTLGIGYLFPVWDIRRQTLADKVMKTVVISQDKTGSRVSQT